MTMAASHSREQPPPNDTINRTAERTSTQKFIIPTLEKQDYTSACKHVVVEVRTLYKNDERPRFINNEKQQNVTATIP